MSDFAKVDIEQMRQSAGDAALMLRSLAHQDRLLLLCQLSQGELCVSDLEVQLGIQQPNLSQQLGVLRREGLVATRREGKHIYYRIGDERVLSLLQTLYGLFCQSPEENGS
ncbi:MAG: metalloregulator ArsR/SmtB family transcription factor [Porticoccaceae bacterium]|nr:metalloregulator ArsR/SmtB family transcription factor [Porticoccaceae bacterium]